MYGACKSPSGQLLPLAEHTEIGTLSDKLIRVDGRASRAHAKILRVGGTWRLEDASTNGTWVNGRKVLKGKACALRVGDQLQFGSPAAPVWRFESDGPPIPFAVCPEDRRLVLFEGRSGILPAEDDPQVEIYQDADRQWWEVRAGATPRIRREPIFSVLDPAWTVYLPTEAETEVADGHLPLGEVSLHLRRGQWEDQVEAWLEHHGERLPLPRSEDWVVAIALAQNQVVDGRMTTDYVDNLVIADEARKPEAHIASYVSRIRKHLATAGVRGARGAIEGWSNRRRFCIHVVIEPTT